MYMYILYKSCMPKGHLSPPPPSYIYARTRFKYRVLFTRGDGGEGGARLWRRDRNHVDRNGFCARPVKGYGQRPKLCKGQLPRAPPPPCTRITDGLPSILFGIPLCSRINQKSSYRPAATADAKTVIILRPGQQNSTTLITRPLIMRVRNDDPTYTRGAH